MQRFAKKLLIPLILVALVCFACGLLGACKPDDEGPDTEGTVYTITFDSKGGASVSDKTWTEGTTLTLPTPGVGSSIDMYGYTFVGWFYDSDCTLAVDRTEFDVSYAQDGVITLYAGWSNVHKIYFDSKTSEVIDPVEYAYQDKVALADLPRPEALKVGSTTCEFLYWIQSNTGNPVTEDFVMDAQDMYFYAYYNIGTNSRFELNEEGYYIPTGSNSSTTQSRYYDYTLLDGQVYSVNMTLPADWSSYSDDSGPVFTGTHFDDASTTFNNGHYVVMFISCQKNFNGAIEFWGTADINGTTTDLSLIARYNLEGNVLKGTPYYEKMKAYQESGEEETFTLSFRRIDNEDGSISWYIGVDGTEYFCFTTGQKPYPTADEGNNTVSAALAGTDDDGNIGSLVGLRAKTLALKYSAITMTENEGAEITFDAGNGTLEGETTRCYPYGQAATLPVPEYDGFEFAGWYYTDYMTGETVALEDGYVPEETIWKITATAHRVIHRSVMTLRACIIFKAHCSARSAISLRMIVRERKNCVGKRSRSIAPISEFSF